MEPDVLQRRSMTTVKNMGINSYSQIISAFRAQGDLTESQSNILPVLQNTFGISRERHTAEVKRALYDEQLCEIAASVNPSSSTTNWEIEANYNCPTIVHRPPNTTNVQLAEQILQSTPPQTIIQYPPSNTMTKLNHDLKQLVNDEVNEDEIRNATQQLSQTSINTSKQNVPNPDMITIRSVSKECLGSKVVRLVRAKQGTKRKSSLDTLIEVVQKELLRVNEQSNANLSPSSTPPHHYSSVGLSSSAKVPNRILTTNRSIISSVLPTSSLATTSHSFKLTRKRGTHDLKVSSSHQRSRSFNDDDENHHFKQRFFDNGQSDSENIDNIVRETLDRIIATVTLDTAPFIVNMLTTSSDNESCTHTESKLLTNTFSTNNLSITKSQTTTMFKPDYYRNDLALLSSTANDVRNTMQQTSPVKIQAPSQQQQQKIHPPQLIIQPTPTTNPLSTIQGTTTPTLFVAPRIINFQTVVPKPTTNIQIGNTKIILVSPSNITQHLPHSTGTTQQSQPLQPPPNLTTNSPVKLVKFTTANNNSQLTTRSATLPMTTTQTPTLTLPKNVQIVIPSQAPSSIQLTRTNNDDLNKSLPTATPTATTTTFRPVTTVPMTLAACALDQIPQAAQEVTITTSPTSSPPLTAANPIDHHQQQQQQSSLGTMTHVSPSKSSIQSPNNTKSRQQSFFSNSLETDHNNNDNGANVEKSRRRSSSSASIDKPVGKILRPIAKVLPVYSHNNSINNDHAVRDTTSSTPIVQQQPHSIANLTTIRTSPTHDEMIKSVTLNLQTKPQPIPRPSSSHGPMIYRMTSVNPNVPVFRVRATTTPTSPTVINKSIKTDTKPISVTTTTNVCYEPKPTHTTSTASGSVSVLACFKTTKKRNKERAIMPRPSTTDTNDATQEFQQRLSTIISTNAALVTTNDTGNSSLTSDYRHQSPSTPTRLVQHNSFSSTLSDENSSNMCSLSLQEQTNDTTTSSSNSIPISRNNTIELTNNNNSSNSIRMLTTPNMSPSLSPLPSSHSTPRTFLEDKSIQCINHKNEYECDEINMTTVETDTIDSRLMIDSESKKRSATDMASNDDSWTIVMDGLLRNVLVQCDFRCLDVETQQRLSSKFDLIQANLVDGVFSSKDDFYNSVLNTKQNILNTGMSKIMEDNVEKLFHHFQTEFKIICEQTHEFKRIRQQ